MSMKKDNLATKRCKMITKTHRLQRHANLLQMDAKCPQTDWKDISKRCKMTTKTLIQASERCKMITKTHKLHNHTHQLQIDATLPQGNTIWLQKDVK